MGVFHEKKAKNNLLELGCSKSLCLSSQTHSWAQTSYGWRFLFKTSLGDTCCQRWPSLGLSPLKDLFMYLNIVFQSDKMLFNQYSFKDSSIKYFQRGKSGEFQKKIKYSRITFHLQILVLLFFFPQACVVSF